MCPIHLYMHLGPHIDLIKIAIHHMYGSYTHPLSDFI